MTVPEDGTQETVFRESRAEAFERRLRFDGSKEVLSRPGAERELGRFERFSLSLAGVDTGVMAACPWESPRYVVLGSSIFLCAILNTFTVFVALTYGLNAGVVVAGIAALIYGIFTITLDRAIGTQFGARPTARSFPLLGTLACRILLGILIASAFSEVFILGIFSTEINSTIVVNQTSALAAAESDRNSTQQEVVVLRQRYDDELRGTGGSGIPGQGPQARELQARLTDAEARLARSTEVIQQLNSNSVDPDSLFARSAALQRLSEQSPYIATLTWSLRILLSVLYCTPALIAILAGSRGDSYRDSIAARRRWMAKNLSDQFAEESGPATRP